MKPKGRYNIKLAKKKGVIAKRVEKTKENIKLFYNLITETSSRDNFNSNSLNYYKVFLEKILSSELIFAYKNNKLISA
jgi:lipid II:glycine glycyltransferase (peptidoglycan interpeptide bridge formation enzyme)